MSGINRRHPRHPVDLLRYVEAMLAPWVALGETEWELYEAGPARTSEPLLGNEALARGLYELGPILSAAVAEAKEWHHIHSTSATREGAA